MMVMMVEMVMLTVMMILMKRPKQQGPGRPPGPPGATYTAVKIPAANGSGRPSEAFLWKPSRSKLKTWEGLGTPPLPLKSALITTQSLHGTYTFVTKLKTFNQTRGYTHVTSGIIWARQRPNFATASEGSAQPSRFEMCTNRAMLEASE